jgi:hypothetical protein
MSNLFETMAEKIKNTKIVLWVFSAALIMFVVGLNHFVEDTLSSYYGIKMLESVLGMRPVTYNFTYWTMSIAPQVAQVVFAYIFMVNTQKNRWAAGAVGVALFVDFFADTWYRSNAGLFESLPMFFAATLLTFAYFTVGSEGFLTVGLGITLELIAPAIKQLILFVDGLISALTGNSRPKARPASAPAQAERKAATGVNRPRPSNNNTGQVKPAAHYRPKPDVEEVDFPFSPNIKKF